MGCFHLDSNFNDLRSQWSSQQWARIVNIMVAKRHQAIILTNDIYPSLLAHIRVTRPRWVKWNIHKAVFVVASACKISKNVHFQGLNDAFQFIHRKLTPVIYLWARSQPVREDVIYEKSSFIGWALAQSQTENEPWIMTVNHFIAYRCI